MEGADPVVFPEQVHAWRAAGLRCIGLSHYGLSNYAHGTSTEGGLTDLGRALLPHVESAGLVLDLTHLADAAFWEAIERFSGPVQCSHQCCRALVPGERQMDDEQLRAVIERGGVVGAALDAWMLHPGWVKEVTENSVVDLSAVADQVDHVCQLAGNSLHAAIGSDLDGGYGQEQTPHDLDTIADLQRVGELLGARGYGEEDVRNVMHANLVRLFRGAWCE
jgi:membrane dipeptidase